MNAGRGVDIGVEGLLKSPYMSRVADLNPESGKQISPHQIHLSDLVESQHILSISLEYVNTTSYLSIEDTVDLDSTRCVCYCRPRSVRWSLF